MLQDEKFAADLGVEFIETADDIDIGELNDLFDKVCGWVGGGGEHNDLFDKVGWGGGS